MHLRKLVLACGLMSIALSNYVSALGLGEVKLKSTLNQPLSAEIQLLDTRDLTAEQIKIALASPADFERNGVDRLYFYTEFQFQVALDNPGGPIVKISTRSPVREPYLNFLIEARWTAGRLLREYTLLMDLPTFDNDAAPPKAVQSAETTKAKSTVSAPTPKPKAAPVTEPTVSAPSYNEEKPAIIAEQDQSAKKSKVAAGTYGPIESKDTLWEIAMAVRPDSSVSVHQTMLALQRLNPDVFIRKNINLIKKGHILRIPDAAEIASVSKSDALREVNSQITQWNEWTGTSTASTGLGAQLDASHHAGGSRREAEPVAGRVKLEAPSAGTSANGQGSGANRGAGKALESELSSTLEELDKAKSEKTELSSRVHDLEDQVKTMQRLVDVSNEKLRSMQVNAAKQAEKTTDKTTVDKKPLDRTALDKAALDKLPPAEKPAETKPADTKKAAPIEPASAAQVSSAATEASSAAEVSSLAASSAPKKVLPKPIVKAPVVVEKSIVDLLLENLLWVIFGVVGLVGAFIFWRQRKSQTEAASSFNESDDLFAPEPSFDHFNEPEEIPEEEEPVDEAALFDEEEETAAVAETGDVVGEADIYIAYGKFDQAEEMLLNGLAKDPSSTDIRLKLLEVYSQTQNVAEFDKHYSAILPFATGFALARASELRGNIAGAGNFDDSAAPEASAPKSGGFNLDDDLDDVSTSTAFTTKHEKPASSNELSFDLDLGEDDASVTRQRPAIKAHEEEEFNLDFDLDDVGEPESQADDLSDISLALDGLDDNQLDDDLEVSSSSSEDEFSFDELEEEKPAPAPVAPKVDTSKPPQLAADDLDFGDEFDLELDTGDHGLGDLDDDLKALATPAPVVAQPAAKPTPAREIEIDDSKPVSDDDDLSWMDDDDESDSFDASQLASGDEFNVDNDDFDLDVSDSNLEDLDASFAELDVDDKPAPAPVAAKPASKPVEKPPVSKPAVPDEIDDEVFEEALSDFSSDKIKADMSDEDMDAELDFMADADEAATKLDLARAYIDMGDGEGARDILAEVAHEGNEQQRKEAVELLSRIDA